LIYVFLSNRVYPDASNTKLLTENIRTDIHDIIYQALLKGKK
jgi:beta-N-acetylhexosaminidase